VTGNAEPGEKYGRAFSPSPLARRLFPREWLGLRCRPSFSTVSKNYAPRCQRCQNNHVARAEIRCECPLPTPSSVGSEPTSKSLKGHEERFPPPRLSGRSAFCEETFAETCGNEGEAPIPAVRATMTEPPESVEALGLFVKLSLSSWPALAPASYRSFALRIRNCPLRSSDDDRDKPLTESGYERYCQIKIVCARFLNNIDW
jgi:hypothetical protein